MEAVADSMAINNRMAFAASAEGTKEMFEKENLSRKRFFGRISKGVGCFDLENGYFDTDEDFPPY